MLREKRETALRTSERNLVSTVDDKKKNNAHTWMSPPGGGASAESAINHAPPLHDVFPLLRECVCALGVLIYCDDAVGLGLQG